MQFYKWDGLAILPKMKIIFHSLLN